MVAGFQPWTGWQFSWTDIVGLYVSNIYLPWQQSIVPYLNFGARFKSIMQRYIFKFVPPSLPHFPPPYLLPLPYWKPAFYFILYQGKLFFVIFFIILLRIIRSHFFIFDFSGSDEIPTLDRLMIFMNWYSQSIHTKDVSTFTTERCDILELWCEVQVYHATLHLLIPPSPHHTPPPPHFPLKISILFHFTSRWVILCYFFHCISVV